MDRADHWIRGFVYCCVRQCGMVHELCEAPRVRTVCSVPNHFRRGGFVLGVATCGVASCGFNLAFSRSSRTRNLKVFVVERLLFGIIVLFGSSSKRECNSARPPPRHSAFPKKLRRLCALTDSNWK